MSSKVLSGAEADRAASIEWQRTSSFDPSEDALESGSGEDVPIVIPEELLERHTQEAHRAGFQEGESAATARAVARLDAATAAFAATIKELASWRGRLRHEAERDLVQLALAIARRVLHREVSVDPEVLLGVAKAALERLEIRDVYRVRVHPEDLPFLSKHLEKLGLPRTVEFAPDGTLTRGGAIFETEKGDLDASLDMQLQEIERGLTDLARRRS